MDAREKDEARKDRNKRRNYRKKIARTMKRLNKEQGGK